MTLYAETYQGSILEIDSVPEDAYLDEIRKDTVLESVLLMERYYPRAFSNDQAELYGMLFAGAVWDSPSETSFSYARPEARDYFLHMLGENHMSHVHEDENEVILMRSHQPNEILLRSPRELTDTFSLGELAFGVQSKALAPQNLGCQDEYVHFLKGFLWSPSWVVGMTTYPLVHVGLNPGQRRWFKDVLAGLGIRSQIVEHSLVLSSESAVALTELLGEIHVPGISQPTFYGSKRVENERSASEHVKRVWQHHGSLKLFPREMISVLGPIVGEKMLRAPFVSEWDLLT